VRNARERNSSASAVSGAADDPPILGDPPNSFRIALKVTRIETFAGWCNRAGLVKSAVLPPAHYDNILGTGEIDTVILHPPLL
jgi:hypothetical protein